MSQSCLRLDDTLKAAIIEPKGKTTKEVKGILKKPAASDKASSPQPKRPFVEVISSTKIQAGESQEAGADDEHEWYEYSWDWEHVEERLEVRIKVHRLVRFLSS